MDIHQLFHPLVPATLAGALDDLTDDARVDAVRRLGRRELAALYEASADSSPLALADFVPDAVGARVEVVHDGKNSLGVFTQFQKRFCRAPGGVLWGYNEQTMQVFTGPGYFIVHPEGNQVVIDYREVPQAQPDDLPAGWPRIIPNSARLSRFIYNGTVDVMRRVSQRVTVGRAQRAGRPMDAWFALVRRNP